MRGWNTEQATVYVDTRDVQIVVEHLAKRLGGTLDHRTLVTSMLDLDVETNDETATGTVSNEDAFLYFPCVIEVFTGGTRVDAAVISAVEDVLSALDELGLDYVTAADFEEELRNAGRRGA